METRETVTGAGRDRWPLASLVVAAVAIWCVVALYFLIAVYFGVRHPFGQTDVSYMVYDGFPPYPGKLDIPLIAIHGFALYMCWRKLVHH